MKFKQDMKLKVDRRWQRMATLLSHESENLSPEDLEMLSEEERKILVIMDHITLDCDYRHAVDIKDGVREKFHHKLFRTKNNRFFIGRNILSEETFHKLTIASKAACAQAAAKVALEHTISSYEDYSNVIRRVKNSNPKLKGDAFEYVDCNNVCLILESSLDRAVSVMKNQDFAITAAKEVESTLPDTAVKVYLTDMDGTADEELLPPTKVSDLTPTTGSEPSGAQSGQFILHTDTFNATSSHDYRLRMWVADDYVVTGDSQSYKLRVNVYGAAAAQ